MAELPNLIKDLALILVVAGVVTLVFKRLKQPLVLGYIVAGFVVSPHMPYTMSVVDKGDIHTWADIGVTFLLLLYLIVLWRGVVTARDAGDTFGRLLATGITSMLAFHVLVNVGMTMGIMPVTGIPLPLMSYGVSSLTTNIMSIAILLNIERRKQKLVF